MNITRLAFRAGYKFRVEETFFVDTEITGHEISTPYIALSSSGKMRIEVGYAWDGASGPAIDTLNFRRGSLVHDALYQLIELDLLGISHRRTADDLLVTICKKDGMWALRRAWVKLGVNTFGARALEKSNPVLFSPESKP